MKENIELGDIYFRVHSKEERRLYSLPEYMFFKVYDIDKARDYAICYEIEKTKDNKPLDNSYGKNKRFLKIDKETKPGHVLLRDKSKNWSYEKYGDSLNRDNPE